MGHLRPDGRPDGPHRAQLVEQDMRPCGGWVQVGVQGQAVQLVGQLLLVRQLLLVAPQCVQQARGIGLGSVEVVMVVVVVGEGGVGGGGRGGEGALEFPWIAGVGKVEVTIIGRGVEGCGQALTPSWPHSGGFWCSVQG